MTNKEKQDIIADISGNVIQAVLEYFENSFSISNEMPDVNDELKSYDYIDEKAHLAAEIEGLKELISRYTESERYEKDYLWDNINMLRLEIVEDVLSYNKTGKIPVKELKRKSLLIKKYSKRLRLLEM